MEEEEMAKSLIRQPGNGGSPLLPRDPFQMFREEMNSLMDRALGRSIGFFDSPLMGGSAAMVMPQIDIHENDKAIVLAAELPGVAEKDVDIAVHDGVMTIKGEKRYEKDEGEGEARVVERQFGSFERSFSLPPGIDDAKIEAKFENGVLKVTLPKRPEAQSSMRHIPIAKH
jgi:HSP20 family protein